ncbi:MAG TPA: asparaginase [Nocardioidaceae bacterium]|nr:asparaginase [Nocardioidaceae bacterium]
MNTATAPRVAVRMLGGTIAMAAPEPGSAAEPVEDVHGLVDAIPELRRRASVDISVLRRLPSASLKIVDVLRLTTDLAEACRAGARGVVATLGTDTMEEVAFLLDRLWTRDEPVVLTGAMRTADAAGADGPANLLAAVTVSADPASAGRGALVVMNDEVHRAEAVRKMHTTNPAAFGSPGAGPVGHVAEGAVHFFAQASRRAALRVDVGADPGTLPSVALLKLGLGAETSLLEYAVSSCDALVVEAFGVGHVPSWWVDPLTEAARAIPVVLASRIGTGPVLRHTYGFPGSEQQLLSAGLLSAGRLDGLKARLLMTLALLAADDPAEATALFEAQTACTEEAQA